MRRTVARRTALLVGVVALVAAACGGDDDDDAAGRSRPVATAARLPTARRPPGPARPIGRAPASRSRSSGGTSRTTTPGCRCGRTSPTSSWPSTRTSRSTSPSTRTRRSRPRSRPRLQAGDPPDLFQSWGGGELSEQVDAGLVRDITRRRRAVDRRPQRGRGGHVPGRRRAVRHPVRPRHGRVLVQQGPVRAGRDHRAAGHVGRVPGGRPDAEGRRDHAARPRRGRQVARHVLVGVPRPAHRRGRRDAAGRRGRLVRQRAVRRGRRRSSSG